MNECGLHVLRWFFVGQILGSLIILAIIGVWFAISWKKEWGFWPWQDYDPRRERQEKP